jgi:hypothetical protein
MSEKIYGSVQSDTVDDVELTEPERSGQNREHSDSDPSKGQLGHVPRPTNQPSQLYNGLPLTKAYSHFHQSSTS